MIHLFIDTNRYLALYRFQKEGLEEIEKLINSIRENKVTLWLPEQVKNEFDRNREGRLSEEYKKIEKLIPKIDDFESLNIPESKDELNKIRQVYNTIIDNKAEINSIVEDFKKKFEIKIKDESFLADTIINNLFSSAKFIPYDETVIKKAFRRFDLGNPPGKNRSYGDSVIWETLLKDFPEGEDLHFVGFDNDFTSKLDKKQFSPFLIKEWSKEKKSKIISYNRLGDFTKAKIPEIESSDKIIEQETKIDNEYLLSIGGEISRALSVYNEVLRKFSEGGEVSRALSVYNEVLRKFSEGGEVSRALSVYNEVLRKFSEHPQALLNNKKDKIGVEKEKETFMTHRDTEEHESNN
jgi:hypothetical protein